MKRRVRWFCFTAATMVILFPQVSAKAQTIRLLSPNSVQAGSVSHKDGSFDLVVFGQGFARDHHVFWNAMAPPSFRSRFRPVPCGF
jgi:hypothetical protein